MLTIPVIAIIGLMGVLDGSGYVGWAFSLLLETFLVVALALFSAFTLRSAVASVLATMGFYVISRMMAFFIVTSQSGMVSGDFKFTVLKYALSAISTVVPRLDLFSKTEWLIYGFNAAQDWMIFTMQVVIFVPLLLLASIADFRIRQF